MNDREHMVQMLARQVLSMRDPDGNEPRVSHGVADAGHATVNVEIRGMVSNIRRQIWIDSAAINAKVVAEIERQAAEIDLDAEIVRVAREEMQRALRDLAQTVRKHVDSRVAEKVYEYVGRLPDKLAAKLTRKFWNEVLA